MMLYQKRCRCKQMATIKNMDIDRWTSGVITDVFSIVDDESAITDMIKTYFLQGMMCLQLIMEGEHFNSWRILYKFPYSLKIS